MNDEDGPKPIVHEVPSALSPYVRRIVADNAGPETGPGTNTYLAGIDEIAVIDPGPDLADHVDAIAGCGGDRVRWILLTHNDRAHAEAADHLRARTGAIVCAFENGPGIDRVVCDGEVIESTEFRLRVIHTPGHAADHLCFLLEEERVLFTGDLVVDGAGGPIEVEFADRDAATASLQQLSLLKRLKAIAPGHGHYLEDTATALSAALGELHTS